MASALNSRDWAVAIWLAVGIVACLTQRDLRSGFRAVLASLLKPKIALPLLAMVAYIAILVEAAAHIHLWESNLTGGTIVWFFGSALALFFNSVDAPKDPHYMRAALARAAGVTILVEGFVNFYVLPLGVELLVVPTITLIVAMAAVAEMKPELAQTRAPINFVLGAIGITLLLYVTIRLASSLIVLCRVGRLPRFRCKGELQIRLCKANEGFSPSVSCRAGSCRSGRSDKVLLSGPNLTQLLRGLALPIWLSLALVPYTYIVGLLATYELAFLQLRFAEPATPQALRRAKLALILGAHGRAHDLVGLAPPWTRRLVGAPTLVDARHVVAELRAERAKAS